MDRKEELRRKANGLPAAPGVYIMKNAAGRVIYVGKSKALHNRVSQYFQGGGTHSEKTRRMVASVNDFEYILTDNEIEALALENKLIKLYAPHYNIRLKDGKSYPYIRFEKGGESFPYISVTRARKKDGADWFGPYSGMKTAYGIVGTLRRVFSLPDCKYRFPEKTGKIKPCLYYQMKRCAGPCVSLPPEEELRSLNAQISLFLSGNTGRIKRELTAEMERCAEDLRFEAAAALRDRVRALERLTDRQKVVGRPGDEYDVISVYEDDRSACMCVMYVRDGALLDTEYIDIGAETILDGDAVISALCELYRLREYAPRQILIDYPLSEQEKLEAEQFFSTLQKKTGLHTPERGAKKQLLDLARENAQEHVKALRSRDEKDLRSLMRLASLLGLEVLPEHIEAVDISNFGSEEITAGFVSFRDGEPCKSDYRLYKMRGVTSQDDYASMREAVTRRLGHAKDQPLPDLLLLDGGKGHVQTVRGVLEQEGVYLPVIGMVKDEHHKTRALTDGENEISIAGEQAVYLLIYKIQEEVHRFAYGSASRSKRKKLKRSVLEDIPGVGPAKARLLLGCPGGIERVRAATVAELKLIRGISDADARNIYGYFHPDKEENKEGTKV